MFKGFASYEVFPITGVDVVTNIFVALLCGLGVSWLYRHTYKGPGYSIAFVNSIVLLTMITAVVLLTIGNNLARAFGLVGAMSIIRFRTAVKDMQDIIYIFFALAVGMAAGVGYHKIALIGTLSIGVVIYVLSKTRAAVPRKEEYLLQFSYTPNGEEVPTYVPVLDRHCRRHQVIHTRSLGAERDYLEISLYVRLRDKEQNGRLVRELQRAGGVSHINLYCDEEQL